MKETRQHLLEDSVEHPDVADRASTEIWGVELRARDRQRKLIAKIDAALARLAPSFLRSVANTFLPPVSMPGSLLGFNFAPQALVLTSARLARNRQARPRSSVLASFLVAIEFGLTAGRDRPLQG